MREGQRYFLPEGCDSRTAALVAAAVSLLIRGACVARMLRQDPSTDISGGSGDCFLIPTAGIGIAAAIDFNSVFVQFHNIFFDNDLCGV